MTCYDKLQWLITTCSCLCASLCLCRTRVLRRKRADLRSQLSAATLRAEQATAQAEARGRKWVLFQYSTACAPRS